MTLHSVVKALIPHAYREQVLGDLQERGLQFRDIVNVLPRIWWTSIARQWTGPVPRMAGAPDSAIVARTEQLARQGARIFAGLTLAFGISLLRLPELKGFQFAGTLVVLTLVLIPVYRAAVNRAFDGPLSFEHSRAKLLTNYRRQIHHQLAFPIPALSSAAYFAVKSGNFAGSPGLSVLLALGVTGLAVRRMSRLRRELQALEVPLV